MRLARSILAVLGWLALASEARPDYQYVFDKPNYAVGLSGTVDVNVFLQETGTSVLATDGLIGAGVRVSFPTPSVAAVLSKADIISNATAFDGGSVTDLGPNFAQITEVVGLTSPPAKATEVAPGTYRILLGTFRFTGLSLGLAGIGAVDIPGFSDTVTATGDVLDTLIKPGRALINVPEPSSASLFSVGVIGVVSYAGWRGRRTSADSTASGLLRQPG